MGSINYMALVSQSLYFSIQSLFGILFKKEDLIEKCESKRNIFKGKSIKYKNNTSDTLKREANILKIKSPTRPFFPMRAVTIVFVQGYVFIKVLTSY